MRYLGISSATSETTRSQRGGRGGEEGEKGEWCQSTAPAAVADHHGVTVNVPDARAGFHPVDSDLRPCEACLTAGQLGKS